MSSAAREVTCFQVDSLNKDPTSTKSKVNAVDLEPMKMPAFALADAVVDVSLSSSASSAISGSASQQVLQEAPAVHRSPSAATDTKSADHTAPNAQPCNAASVTVSHIPIVQLLSAVDSVKWGQVAAWAAGDSAQAAALVEHLGPSLAESIASEADQDQALLRLEAQVVRKKLVRLATKLIRSCLASRFVECVATFQCTNTNHSFQCIPCMHHKHIMHPEISRTLHNACLCTQVM